MKSLLICVVMTIASSSVVHGEGRVFNVCWKDRSNNEIAFIVEESIEYGPYLEFARVEPDVECIAVQKADYRAYCYRVKAVGINGTSGPNKSRCTKTQTF